MDILAATPPPMAPAGLAAVAPSATGAPQGFAALFGLAVQAQDAAVDAGVADAEAPPLLPGPITDVAAVLPTEAPSASVPPAPVPPASVPLASAAPIPVAAMPPPDPEAVAAEEERPPPEVAEVEAGFPGVPPLVPDVAPPAGVAPPAPSAPLSAGAVPVRRPPASADAPLPVEDLAAGMATPGPGGIAPTAAAPGSAPVTSQATTAAPPPAVAPIGDTPLAPPPVHAAGTALGQAAAPAEQGAAAMAPADGAASARPATLPAAIPSGVPSNAPSDAPLAAPARVTVSVAGRTAASVEAPAQPVPAEAADPAIVPPMALADLVTPESAGIEASADAPPGLDTARPAEGVVTTPAAEPHAAAEPRPAIESRPEPALGAPLPGLDQAGRASAAPMPRAAPPLPIAWPSRQVAPFAVALALGPDSSLTLTLDPVELGRVEVAIDRIRGEAAIRVSAERPETLALLQRDARELERALSDAGFGDRAPPITFSLSQGSLSHGSPGQQGLGRGDAEPGGPRDAPGPSSGFPRLAATETSPRRTLHRGLIDLAV